MCVPTIQRFTWVTEFFLIWFTIVLIWLRIFEIKVVIEYDSIYSKIQEKHLSINDAGRAFRWCRTSVGMVHCWCLPTKGRLTCPERSLKDLGRDSSIVRREFRLEGVHQDGVNAVCLLQQGVANEFQASFPSGRVHAVSRGVSTSLWEFDEVDWRRGKFIKKRALVKNNELHKGSLF